jgi:hypothetical protein
VAEAVEGVSPSVQEKKTRNQTLNKQQLKTNNEKTNNKNTDKSKTLNSIAIHKYLCSYSK